MLSIALYRRLHEASFPFTLCRDESEPIVEEYLEELMPYFVALEAKYGLFQAKGVVRGVPIQTEDSDPRHALAKLYVRIHKNRSIPANDHRQQQVTLDTPAN